MTSVSETRIHYSTINRRTHELLERRYLEQAGARTTKAGSSSSLYALTQRGEFAAFAGIPDEAGGYRSEFSPKEIRQVVSIILTRNKSPLVLLGCILQEGKDGARLVEKELVPEIIRGVRSGFINIDAPEENAISSAYASLVARKAMDILDSNKGQSEYPSKVLEIVTHALDTADKTVSMDGSAEMMAANPQRIQPLWIKEIRALLRLYSVKYY